MDIRDITSDSINYNAESIKQDVGRTKFRTRVAQYLGSDDSVASRNMFFEIYDNALDEAIAYSRLLAEKGIYYPAQINISISNDEIVEIQDFGRGIPCEPNSQGVPAVYLTVEEDSAGGKGRGTEGYSGDTAGTHGVGMTATMSNCEFMNLEIRNLSGQGVFRLAYKESERAMDLVKISELEPFDYNSNGNIVRMFHTGTTVQYRVSPITIKRTLGGTPVDFMYNKEELLERIHTTILGEDSPVIINFKFRDDEVMQISPQSYTPMQAMGVDHMNYFQIIYKDTPKSNGVKIIDNTLKANIGLIASTGVQAFKTIVNRLNVERSTSNKAIIETLKLIIPDIMRREGSKVKYDPEVDFKPGDMLGYFSAFTKLEYSNASFTGQTKSEMSNSDIIPVIKENLKAQLFDLTNPQTVEFRSKLFGIVYEKYKDEVRLHYYSKRMKEEQKKAEEISEKKRKLQEEREKFMRGELTTDDMDPDEKIKTISSEFPRSSSTIVLLEGESALTIFENFHQRIEGGYPIYFAALKGKIKNIEGQIEEDPLSIFNSYIVKAFKAKILDQGYQNIAILTDGDIDATHIRILILNLIWNIMPEYITSGRVFIIPAPYSRVYINKKISIPIDGEGIKTYDVGTYNTYSEEEHNELLSYGMTSIKIYTGFADDESSPVDLVLDTSKWKAVTPPTRSEVTLMKNMMTVGHHIKKDFTRKVYSKRKDSTDKFAEIALSNINRIGQIRNPMLYKTTPSANYSQYYNI